MPDWSTVDLAAVAIAGAAMVAMFRYHVGMITTLAASAAVGLIYFVAQSTVSISGVPHALKLRLEERRQQRIDLQQALARQLDPVAARDRSCSSPSCS